MPRADSSPAIGAWTAVSVETFRPAEIKHDICVRSFHRMRSFHVLAACGTAAPREPGMRGRPGTARLRGLPAGRDEQIAVQPAEIGLLRGAVGGAAVAGRGPVRPGQGELTELQQAFFL